MAMMRVGHVRMSMAQADMEVAVTVGLARGIPGSVRMTMMLVMDMPVAVLRRLVLMIMRVALGQV